MTKRTTIYLDPKLHYAIKMKAVQVRLSISDLISEAIRLSLREDSLDIQAIKDRSRETTRSYEEVLKDLKRDDLL